MSLNKYPGDNMCGIVGIIKKDGQHICEDEFIKFQRMLIVLRIEVGKQRVLLFL